MRHEDATAAIYQVREWFGALSKNTHVGPAIREQSENDTASVKIARLFFEKLGQDWRHAN